MLWCFHVKVPAVNQLWQKHASDYDGYPIGQVHRYPVLLEISQIMPLTSSSPSRRAWVSCSPVLYLPTLYRCLEFAYVISIVLNAYLNWIPYWASLETGLWTPAEAFLRYYAIRNLHKNLYTSLSLVLHVDTIKYWCVPNPTGSGKNMSIPGCTPSIAQTQSWIHKWKSHAN